MVLDRSLRIGDVAAKYSDSQFIVLLPSCPYEGGNMVAERIIRAFEQANSRLQNVELAFNLEEVAATNKIVK